MFLPRVIPVLLLRNRGLVKSVRFKNHKYVGDPINAVRIFNDKEVDELIFLDITATVENRKPPIKLLSEIANECFMPLCYGGGIKSIEDIKGVINIGIEKIAINSHAVEQPSFIKKASGLFGSSTIVVSIDVKKNSWDKYEVISNCGTKNTNIDPVSFAVQMEQFGAGEILLNSIDRDGTMEGYDINLIKNITDAVSIPVVASGGARGVHDFADAIKKGGASAVAAGSLFVFYGIHRAVLINFPTQQELKNVLF